MTEAQSLHGLQFQSISASSSSTSLLLLLLLLIAVVFLLLLSLSLVIIVSSISSNKHNPLEPALPNPPDPTCIPAYFLDSALANSGHKEYLRKGLHDSDYAVAWPPCTEGMAALYRAHYRYAVGNGGNAPCTAHCGQCAPQCAMYRAHCSWRITAH